MDANENTENVLLNDREIEEGFRTLFIKSGYRRPGLTLSQCFSSLLQPNNEAVNVWSHFIAFGLFCLQFYHVFFGDDDVAITSVRSYPLLCFAAGILSLMAMSSIAHFINCISLTAHHTGFYLDYAAICVYSFSGSLAFYFYARPINTAFISPGVFLSISALLCCISVAVSCFSRHQWKKTGHLVRTTLFFFYFFLVTLPFTYRVFMSNEPKTESHHYFNRLIMNYVISAVVNVTKLPERAFPQAFDFCGQSHHFLHVFSALAASDAFNVAYYDMKNREKDLVNLQQPDFYNSLGIFSLVVIINLLVVGWFVRSLLLQEKEKKQ